MITVEQLTKRRGARALGVPAPSVDTLLNLAGTLLVTSESSQPTG